MSNGWECPRCHACYGPFVWRCPNCKTLADYLRTDSTFPFPACPPCVHDYGEMLTQGRVCRKCGQVEPPPQRTVITS